MKRSSQPAGTCFAWIWRIFLGGGPVRAGWGQRGLVEGLPLTEGEVQGTCLSDVSHVGKGVLQFSEFGVDPALTPAMATEVRSEERSWIHFGAAFLAFDPVEISPIKRDDIGFFYRRRFHFSSCLRRKGDRAMDMPAVLGITDDG